MKSPMFILIITVFTSGCVSYPIERYAISTRNVMDIKRLTEKENIQIGLGKFSREPEEINRMMCRGVPIYTTDEEPLSQLVKGAIKQELELAGVYSSQLYNLSIKFIKLDLNSWEGFWDYIALVNLNGETFKVEYRHGFKSAFFGDNACQNSVKSFNDSVQDFIGNLLRSKEFQKNLLKGKKVPLG